MKAVRIISIVVLAGMLAGALALAFPAGAAAQGTNPPAPTSGQGTSAQQVERLEKAYQRELKVLDAQAKRLAGADQRAQKFTERIADLKSKGKDTTDLEEALTVFKDVLKEANGVHNKAAVVIKTHAGFDDQGKVTDLQKARVTVRDAEKLLREAHLDLRPAVRDLVRALREFVRDNRGK